jgi:C-terminal processing protease CtpA/Prc
MSTLRLHGRQNEYLWHDMKGLIYFVLIFVTLNGAAQSYNYDVTVSKIKSLIAEHYIVNEKVKVICDSLSKVSDGGMKPQEFVERVNLQLQRHSADKHLRIEYNPEYVRKTKSGIDVSEDQRVNERTTNFGFNKMEILEGNTGLLKLTYFADPENLEDLIRGTFNFLKNTDQLIVDVRGNSGGSGSMLQKLISVFLAERSASVLRIKYKQNEVQLKTDPEPLSSYHKPVYLLCDQSTFSAGEGFVMILKNRKRVTVIGETTARAGNISGPYVVDDNFIITIPVGIITDVLTGKGWEGSGVTPDVEATSKDALTKALEVIRGKR